MHDQNHLYIEEIANSITHGIGLLFSLAGLGALLFLTWMKGSTIHFVSCGIYGATLVLIYAASTIYHSVRNPRIKHYFQVFDHVAIYLIIAGTYTPFTLVSLRGFWGWLLFGAVWTLSLFGIVFRIVFADRFKALRIALYLVSAWLAILAIKPMLAAIPLAGIIWLVVGGVAYTSGLIFFAWEKLRFNHAIWHLFVMAGSVCHYCAVILYVVKA